MGYAKIIYGVSFASRNLGKVTPTGNTGGSDIIAVTGVNLTLSKTSAKVNETVILNASVLPTNATNKTVTFSVSDNTAASISGNVLTCLKAGNITVYATASNGVRSSKTLIITNESTGGDTEDTTITSIAISASNTNLVVGENNYITLNVTTNLSNPGDLTDRISLYYVNEYNGTVRFDGFRVIPTGAGSVTIVAKTDDGSVVSNELTFNITEAPAIPDSMPYDDPTADSVYFSITQSTGAGLPYWSLGDIKEDDIVEFKAKNNTNKSGVLIGYRHDGNADKQSFMVTTCDEINVRDLVTGTDSKAFAAVTLATNKSDSNTEGYRRYLPQFNGSVTMDTTAPHTYVVSRNIFRIDGVDVDYGDTNKSYTSGVYSASARLGVNYVRTVVNQNNTTSLQRGLSEIYYVKVTRDGQVVHYYKPQNDGTFKDLITNESYASVNDPSGTGITYHN